jgi:hypothetical protein
MAENSVTGLMEIADSMQSKRVERLVDLQYGVDSDLVNCNVNEIRAELLRRYRERVKLATRLMNAENQVVAHNNARLNVKNNIAMFFSKLDHRNNLALRVNKGTQYEDRGFERFLQRVKSHLYSSQDLYVRMRKKEWEGTRETHESVFERLHSNASPKLSRNDQDMSPVFRLDSKTSGFKSSKPAQVARLEPH